MASLNRSLTLTTEQLLALSNAADDRLFLLLEIVEKNITKNHAKYHVYPEFNHGS